jgi:hypothetical protein
MTHARIIVSYPAAVWIKVWRVYPSQYLRYTIGRRPMDFHGRYVQSPTVLEKYVLQDRIDAAAQLRQFFTADADPVTRFNRNEDHNVQGAQRERGLLDEVAQLVRISLQCGKVRDIVERTSIEDDIGVGGFHDQLNRTGQLADEIIDGEVGPEPVTLFEKTGVGLIDTRIPRQNRLQVCDERRFARRVAAADR